jgi:hypothetical protein
MDKANTLFKNATKGLGGEELDKAKKAHEKTLEVITTTSRGIVQRFLNRNFKFDPDSHVRTSHTPRTAKIPKEEPRPKF